MFRKVIEGVESCERRWKMFQGFGRCFEGVARCNKDCKVLESL